MPSSKKCTKKKSHKFAHVFFERTFVMTNMITLKGIISLLLTNIVIHSFTFYPKQYNNPYTFQKRKSLDYKANDENDKEKGDILSNTNSIISLLFKNLFPKEEKPVNEELKDVWPFLSSKYVSNLTVMEDDISLMNVESLLSFMEDGNSTVMADDGNNTKGITSETLENVIFNNFEFFTYLLQEAMQQGKKP